jgi:hypothetical protein
MRSTSGERCLDFLFAPLRRLRAAGAPLDHTPGRSAVVEDPTGEPKPQKVGGRGRVGETRAVRDKAGARPRPAQEGGELQITQINMSTVTAPAPAHRRCLARHRHLAGWMSMQVAIALMRIVRRSLIIYILVSAISLRQTPLHVYATHPTQKHPTPRRGRSRFLQLWLGPRQTEAELPAPHRPAAHAEYTASSSHCRQRWAHSTGWSFLSEYDSGRISQVRLPST